MTRWTRGRRRPAPKRCRRYRIARSTVAYETATNRLFVASAANPATAIALEETFNRVAAAQGGPAVRVTDVKPLPAGDPNGTAAFYAVIAWMLSGYIGATLIGLIDDLKVHSLGPTEADVTEGSGGVWERLHYDWSDPNRVVLRTTDSNTWNRASGYTYTFKPVSG